MRSATRIALLAALLPGASAAHADPPPDDARRSRVDMLLAELDAETLSARVAAERALLDLGPDVLPLLPAPEQLPSASVRETVRRLRVRLEKTKAERSIEPSRVTLHGKRSLTGLVAEISSQTGNGVSLGELPQRLREREVSVNLDGVTFWHAIDQLARAADLRLSNAPESRAVVLAERGPNSASLPFSADFGPVRVSTPGASTKELVGNNADRLVRVPLALAMEPRLRPLFAHYAARDLHATRPDGSDIPAFTPEARYELPVLEGGHALRLSLDFLSRADAVPRDISLRGTVGVLMAAGTELFAFPLLADATGTARRKGGVTVTRLDVVTAPEEDKTTHVKVGMAVAYDVGGPAFESHRQWIFYNEAYLEDAQGRRISREAEFSTRQQADGRVVVEYEFARVAGKLSDYRFVYSAPTLLIDVPVQFEISGVRVGP